MMEDRGLDTPLAAIEHAFNRSISGEFASAIACRDSVVIDTVSGAEVCRKLSPAKSPSTFSLTEAAEVKDRWASRSTTEGESLFGREDSSDVTTVPQSSTSPSAELPSFPPLSGSYLSSPLLSASPMDIGDASHRRASTSSSDVQCSLATPLEKFVKAPACSESSSAVPSPLTTACTHITSSPGSEAFPGASDGLVDTQGLDEMQRNSSRRPSNEASSRLKAGYLFYDSALCAESFGSKDGAVDSSRVGGCAKTAGDASSAEWSSSASRFEGFSSPKQPSYNDEAGSSGVSLDSAGDSLEYVQLQSDDAPRRESDAFDENRLIVDFQLLLILLFDQVCHMVPDLRRQDGGAFYSFHLERIVGGQLRPTLSGYAELLLPICSASSLFEDEDGFPSVDEAGVENGSASSDPSLLVSAALRYLIRNGTVPPAKVASIVSRCPAVVFIQVVSALQSVYNLQRLLTPEAPVFRQAQSTPSSSSDLVSSRSASLASGDAFSEESLAAMGCATSAELLSPANPHGTPQSCGASAGLAESPPAASMQRQRGGATGGGSSRRGKGPGGTRAAPALDVGAWKNTAAAIDSFSRSGIAKTREEGAVKEELLMRALQTEEVSSQHDGDDVVSDRRDFGSSSSDLGTKSFGECSGGGVSSVGLGENSQQVKRRALHGSAEFPDAQLDSSPRFISASVNKRRHPNIQAEILNTCCPERLAERSSRLLGEVLQKLRCQEQQPRTFQATADVLAEASLLRDSLRLKHESSSRGSSASASSSPSPQAEGAIGRESVARNRKRKTSSASGGELEDESTLIPLPPAECNDDDAVSSCGARDGLVSVNANGSNGCTTSTSKPDAAEETQAATLLMGGQFKAHGYALRKGSAKKAKRASLTTETTVLPTVSAAHNTNAVRRAVPSRTQCPATGRTNHNNPTAASASSVPVVAGTASPTDYGQANAAAISASPVLSQQLLQLTNGESASSAAFPAALSSTMRGVFFNRSLNRWVCTWSRNGKEYQRSWSAGKYGYETARGLAMHCRLEKLLSGEAHTLQKGMLAVFKPVMNSPCTMGNGSETYCPPGAATARVEQHAAVEDSERKRGESTRCGASSRGVSRQSSGSRSTDTLLQTQPHRSSEEAAADAHRKSPKENVPASLRQPSASSTTYSDMVTLMNACMSKSPASFFFESNKSSEGAEGRTGGRKEEAAEFAEDSVGQHFLAAVAAAAAASDVPGFED